jgi:hypothetical protein
MAESASRGGGQIALLVVFLVASLFLSAAIGAAAGFVVFPAAQFIVILLPLEKEQWPAALALICAGFYLAMAMAYLMWVYGSPASRLLKKSLAGWNWS